MRYKFPKKYTDEQIIKEFDNHTDAINGLIASDIANKIKCHRDTAKTRLNNLVEKGVLRKAKIGTNVVYWRDKNK